MIRFDGDLGLGFGLQQVDIGEGNLKQAAYTMKLILMAMRGNGPVALPEPFYPSGGNIANLDLGDDYL